MATVTAASRPGNRLFPFPVNRLPQETFKTFADPSTWDELETTGRPLGDWIYGLGARINRGRAATDQTCTGIE